MLSEIGAFILLSLPLMLEFEQLLAQQKIRRTLHPITFSHHLYLLLISRSSQPLRCLHRSKHIKGCFFGLTIPQGDSVPHVEIVLFILGGEGVDEGRVGLGFFDLGTVTML